MTGYNRKVSLSQWICLSLSLALLFEQVSSFRRKRLDEEAVETGAMMCPRNMRWSKRQEKCVRIPNRDNNVFGGAFSAFRRPPPPPSAKAIDIGINQCPEFTIWSDLWGKCIELPRSNPPSDIAVIG